MVRQLLAIVAIAFISSGYANAEEFPKSMFDFLKPGSTVLLDATGGQTTLTLFANERAIEISQATHRLSLEELRERFHEVDEQARQLLRVHVDQVSRDGTKAQKLRKPNIALLANRGYYYKIVHVGSDYVLAEREGVRFAYAKHQLVKLAFNHGEVLLRVSPARSSEFGHDPH